MTRKNDTSDSMRLRASMSVSGFRTYCEERAEYHRMILSNLPPINAKFHRRGVVGASHVWDTKTALEQYRASHNASLSVYEAFLSFNLVSDEEANPNA